MREEKEGDRLSQTTERYTKVTTNKKENKKLLKKKKRKGTNDEGKESQEQHEEECEKNVKVFLCRKSQNRQSGKK